MERIKTLETRDLNQSVQTGGCGELPASRQSPCQDLWRVAKPEGGSSG